MSSNSDMESVSISDVEMEADEQVAPVTTSQPLPQASAPIAGISLPQPSSQPTPKRTTMRERTHALREARLKKNQTKTTKKQSADVAGKNSAQNGTDKMQGGEPDKEASISVPRQKATLRKSPRSSSKAASESVVEPNTQEPQSLVSGHQSADGKKSEAQGTARVRKGAARRENPTKRGAKTTTVIPKPAVSHGDPDNTTALGPHESVPNGHNAPSKDSSQTLKTSSGARKDQRKRKSTADPVQEKDRGNDSGSESDVILLQSKVISTAPPRARKKARVENAKSAASPKATSKSLRKKRDVVIPPSPSATTVVVPVTVVPMEVQQNDDEAPSKKKKTSKKSARAEVRILDDDEPIVVRHKRVNKSATGIPSKEVSLPGTAEQTPKPVPVKRRPGRPRKYPKVDAPESQPTPKATMEEENRSTANTVQDAPVPEKKSQRQAKPRVRKTKQVTPDESESANKTSKEDEGDFAVSKVKAAPRRTSSSVSKRRAPRKIASEQAQKPDDDHEGLALVGAKNMEPKQSKAAGSEAHVTERSQDSVGQSPIRAVQESTPQPATKSKRLSFAPSPRETNVMLGKKLNKNVSRRQSLSHQEGLSRLTSVVDQLQREGEVFLQTEHRICDQLVPFAFDRAAHIVPNLPHGKFSAPVSEDDRRAIADAALRDAVMHAKLEYQANHRAAISKLAENLVQAVKNWKNAKNTVLRDIIPEDLRPTVEVPVDSVEEIGHNVEALSSTPVEDRSEPVAPEENAHGGDKEPIQELDENKIPQATVIGKRKTTLEERDEAVARLRVLENAEAVKKYVGFSYSDLNLDGYRVCAILKLCEFIHGLSFDELYAKTPFGRSMLKKTIISLMEANHLIESTMEMSSGQLIAVYRTAPNIIKSSGSSTF
ncbi:zinc finger protein [Gracilaria domingensis]|nr:zinc finger protein [Gracilaria domingensis]